MDPLRELVGANARQTLELTRRYEGVFASVGLHPGEIPNVSVCDLKELALLASEPKVVAIESLIEGTDEREALRLAASLERASEHPLANAIVNAATERGIELTNATNIETTPGRGIRGIVNGA